MVLTECAMILLNRFHYTLDVFLSLVLTYFVYTNAPVAGAAAWWSRRLWLPGPERDDFNSYRDGDTLIPPCFPPFFCFLGSRIYVQREAETGHAHEHHESSDNWGRKGSLSTQWNKIAYFIHAHRMHNPYWYKKELEAVVDWGESCGDDLEEKNTQLYGKLDLDFLKSHL